MGKLISKENKILLAGSSGMAGKAILRELISKGYGRAETGGEIFIPNRKTLNYLNFSEVKEWFAENSPNIVIVAAAKVGGIVANASNPTQFLLDNLKIQTNLIENAWKHDVKRLLFLGSSCIYPKFATQPIDEESLLTGSLESTNECYAIAKIAGIKLCEALRKQYGFDAISLMPTNLYGPGDNYHPNNSHVMASLIRKFSEASRDSLDSVTCWGSGNPRREFLHVDDLANAVLFTLENWDPNMPNSPKDKYGEPLSLINVGTGIDISISDLSEKIAKITGFKGLIKWDRKKPDGTPKKLLNISRLRSIGWKSNINLDTGLFKTINDYRDNHL